jgi:hypothetical protein
MKKVSFLLIIFVSCYGCEKEKQINSSSSIIGEWEWLSTCGGFSGQCSTPKTSNSAEKLVFTVDSMYYHYQNNSLVSSSIFHIVIHLPEPNDTIKILQINNTNQAFSIIHDTLSMSFIGADFGSSYKRIK